MNNMLSSASHHAMLFAFITKEIVNEFNELGETVIEAGVVKYGNQRGHRMALRTKADGNEINVMNYLVYGEWEALPGQMDLKFPEYAPEVKMQNYKCPWHTEWSKRGLLNYGKLYCRYVDTALARGYKCDMKLKLKSSRVEDAKCCDFLFEGQSIEDKDQEMFKELRRKIGNKAKMPWEYHVGHLYKTLKEVALEKLGRECEEAFERALNLYEKEYGYDAKELVIKYQNIDYNAMPKYEGIDK